MSTECPMIECPPRRGNSKDLTREVEMVRAYRDTWSLGIHSYLAYLRDRLSLARELLTDSGSIFVQIGDENAQRIRSLLDEVFGENNFCSGIGFRKTGAFDAGLLQRNYDYVFWYAKNKNLVKFRQAYQEKRPSA